MVSGRQAAQAVVAAKFEDQDVDSRAQEPVQPVQTAGAGVAALAGVDGSEQPLFGVDLFLNQRGVGLRRFEAVAGGDAVAKEQNVLWLQVPRR